MKVITSIEDIIRSDEFVVALGTFDGIHIGHLEILQDAVVTADIKGYKSACLTFSNHPYNYINGLKYNDEGSVKLLCSEEQKLGILDHIGFDYVINIPFDERIMTMRANDFIHHLLKDKLNAKILCCGFNYSFGIRAEGNVATLKREGAAFDMQVNAHDAVKYNGNIVSSTAVRGLVREGSFELVSKYLGRDYSISGTVIHGNKIGSDIGYPTMNLAIPAELELPPNGVYFSKAIINNKEYNSITNIGCKPTVGSNEKLLETHIFDYYEDVYGDNLTIKLLKFHRPEIKFDSLEQLQAQIAVDCELGMMY